MAFKTNTMIVNFDVTITVSVHGDVVADIVREAHYIDEYGNHTFGKINAIKALRDWIANKYRVSLGLRDSKEIIEAMYSHMYPD